MGRELKNLAQSFVAAFRGVVLVVRHGRNFRIHICMMLYVIIFSLIGNVGKDNFLRFVLCFGLVMGAEGVNTAIEQLCNSVALGYDRRIRDIKDISAGAVLVCAGASAVVGLSVFLSPEVLLKVGERFVAMPYLAVIIALSIPLAVLFIFKRGMK